MSKVHVYVMSDCPNCTRFLASLRRLPVRAKVVDVRTARHLPEGLQAVPTVVGADGVLRSATAAFEWLHAQEHLVPLDEYATVMGQGSLGGLDCADFATEQTVSSDPFAPFTS